MQTAQAISFWQASIDDCSGEGSAFVPNANSLLQAGIVAFIVGTVFLRTQLHADGLNGASAYAAMLFFSLLQMFFNGIAEMTFTVRLLLPSVLQLETACHTHETAPLHAPATASVCAVCDRWRSFDHAWHAAASCCIPFLGGRTPANAVALLQTLQPPPILQIDRLPVFFKQRDALFFPTWAFVLPTNLGRLPISVLESFIWVVLTYWEVGLAPNAGRFFVYWLLIFLIHSERLRLPKLDNHQF